MIEQGIKEELEALTGLEAYPTILPAGLQDGVVYRLISDPEIEVGLTRVNLIRARYQITFAKLNGYGQVKAWERQLWAKWREIRHGQIGETPVQYVERGQVLEDVIPLTDHQNIHTLTRDYVIYYRESQ